MGMDEGAIKKKAIVTQMIVVIMMKMFVADAADTNDVFSPCLDAKVQKSDGFTFGLAFSTKESFFLDQTQLSPCDRRLALSGKGAQLSVFRPKVDEISLLTINSSTFDPVMAGGFMVAFAGQKYAARSLPIMVADNTNTITSFTLVLEFQQGTLQNLYWKNFGCDACSGDSFVCLNNQDCAVPTSKCKSKGGNIECNIGIQLTFSGTDKNLNALNSWYEVGKLRQYSLYGLYSDLRDSVAGEYGKLI
ncbi:CSL zinc finger domain-containing protein [Quillaja saponaria]|uniref:CSL zinc finger domain-containing protein n=1 Tax=Quillaja saponaria TaxID=32244 RepID=A0AAD7KU00_QUISA|nr:CSL zinc finger domain-containing protein [Quillaja saponaria]